MVARPGGWPASRSLSIRGARSAKTASATGPPGSIRAVIAVPSMEEVTRFGEVQGDTGRLAGLDCLVVAHRAARLDDGADAGVDQHLRPVGKGEERVTCGYRTFRAVAGTRDSEAARVDPVDLTHADADSCACGSEQDRVGLDRTARGPCERKVTQRLLVNSVARRQRPGSRVVAGRVHRVHRLHEQAAADRPHLDAVTTLARLTDEQADRRLLVENLDRAVVEARRAHDL